MKPEVQGAWQTQLWALLASDQALLPLLSVHCGRGPAVCVPVCSAPSCLSLCLGGANWHNPDSPANYHRFLGLSFLLCKLMVEDGGGAVPWKISLEQPRWSAMAQDRTPGQGAAESEGSSREAWFVTLFLLL